jgi:tetratricopeptide (TPR) repeat protein
MRDLMRDYREAKPEQRVALATELLGAAEPNYDLLSKLSGIETNTEQRMKIFGSALIPAVVAAREIAVRDEVDEVAFGELMKTVRLWEAVLPEDPTMPLLLLPRLQKWGKAEQADALWAKAFAAQQQVCDRSPQSAEAHNNLAWLCAITRRQLETGLVHAQKAVALAPKTAAYLDTLAEVEFQLGRPKHALELIKQAVELAPDFEYFQQQQARMQKGDRASFPPEPDQEFDEATPPEQ